MIKYFAKLGLNSKVQEVHLLGDNDAPTEKAGIACLHKTQNYPFWVQTFKDRSQRKNYAGTGYTYDEDRDAFIPPRKPHPSWVFNEDKCLYDPPVPYPDDGQRYYWDEEAHQADNTTGWELSDTGP